MNKAILMGRLTKDPEIRYSNGPEQTAVGRFTLAVDRRGQRQGNQQNADFIPCVAFGKKAEFVEKYFHSGSRVLVVGRVQNNNYTTKEGNKVYGFSIITEEVEFAQKKSAGKAAADADDFSYAADEQVPFESR